MRPSFLHSAPGRVTQHDLIAEQPNPGTRVRVTIPCISLVSPEPTVTPILKDSLPNKAAKSVLAAAFFAVRRG